MRRATGQVGANRPRPARTEAGPARTEAGLERTEAGLGRGPAKLPRQWVATIPAAATAPAATRRVAATAPAAPTRWAAGPERTQQTGRTER